MGLERLYNLSVIYGILATIITIISFINHQFAIFAFIFNVTGVLVLLWNIYGSTINMKFVIYYDDFRRGFRKDLWECRLPPYTLEKDPQAVDFKIEVDSERQVLEICALKRDVGFPSKSPLKWEGPKIVARKNGYNLIMAKIMLNFKESTAERGNIYLSGRGRLGRFEYLIGIDKTSKDVFFHIWDKEAKASYGPPKVGSYIKERGRTHLKDYLTGQGERYLILGIEWGFDGPKFFAFKEGEKDFAKIPANPPPEIRGEILKDSRNIFLYGLSEFAIRTDLVAKDPKIKESIKGAVKYVKVKQAPLSWIISIIISIQNLLKTAWMKKKRLVAQCCSIQSQTIQ